MTIGLVLLAITLGLDVFAGGVALGVGRLERDRWTGASAVFACFTFLMTGLGVVFGRLLGERFGHIASYVAGAGLIGVGIWAVSKAVADHDDPVESQRKPPSWNVIIVTGVVVCLDKLAVGVSLAFVETSLTLLIGYLVVQSFGATMAGIALGVRYGGKLGHAAEMLAGLIFALLGVIIIYQTAVGHDLM